MKSNIEWRFWGRTDPLWSVASWPGKAAADGAAWTDDEFLSLGKSDFDDILRQWEHYGLSKERCVEIGCGAGRMTSQLASAFGSVAALDVSAEQIDRAKRILGERASNCEFLIVDKPSIPLPDGTASAMFSCHVFQHFAEFGGVVEYLSEAHRVVRVGGTICFHVPVPGAHRNSTASKIRLATRNVALSIKRMFGGRRPMEYNRYSPTLIFKTLEQLGFDEPEMRIFNMKSNGDAHSFFFARRSQQCDA